MIILSMILTIFVLILSYTTYNLMKKNERLETIVEFQQNYVTNLDDAIKYSNEKLIAIDQKGSFKADDEIGWFFKNVQYIQDLLNTFRQTTYEEAQKTLEYQAQNQNRAQSIQNQIQEDFNSQEAINFNPRNGGRTNRNGNTNPNADTKIYGSVGPDTTTY